jgi:hypothetical protein
LITEGANIPKIDISPLMEDEIFKSKLEFMTKKVRTSQALQKFLIMDAVQLVETFLYLNSKDYSSSLKPVRTSSPDVEEDSSLHEISENGYAHVDVI